MLSACGRGLVEETPLGAWPDVRTLRLCWNWVVGPGACGATRVPGPGAQAQLLWAGHRRLGCRHAHQPMRLVLGFLGLSAVTCDEGREYGGDKGPGMAGCTSGLGSEGRMQ